MVSCLTLMPVISVNALASVFDSYSCVVMVSDTTLISMPLKGSAALAYHCSSFIWSAFDRVEGWNSESIHLWFTASSARAGAATVTDAAISAAALVMARYLLLLTGLPLKCRMLVPPVAATNIQARVDPGSALFRIGSDGAENHNGHAKRNHGCEPQARYFNALADRERKDRIGADEPDPRQMDHGGQNQRDEQAVAARGRNPQHADTLGLGIGHREPGHRGKRERQYHEEDRGRQRPGHPCDVFHGDSPTPGRARNRARCS